MSKELPVLIVDKKGILGSLVAQKISNKTLVILVSKLVPQDNDNIVHVPFSGSVPQIPDNTYSRILIVDDKTTITKEAFETYLKKAKGDDAYLFFITFLGQPLGKINPQIDGYGKAKIILIGEVFDEQYILEENTPTTFIEQIKKEGRIDLKGDGTGVSFPISLIDVVNGISNLIFEDTKGALICLFPKNPITHLSLAHMFQKQNPLIKVDFKKASSTENSLTSPLNGYFYLGNGSDLPHKIKELKIEPVKKVTETEIINTPYFFKKSVLAFLFSLIFIILLPLVSNYTFSFLGARELLGVKENLLKGNFGEAQKNAQTANILSKVAKYSSGVLKIEAGIIGQEVWADNLTDQTESLYLVSQAGIYLTESAKKLSLVFTSSSYSRQDFLDGVNALKSSVAKFRELEARNGLPPTLKNQLSEYSMIIDLFDNSIDHFPKALGFEGEKKYLLLFLNNMELRPGGGFIGSYGVVTIKDGKVGDFKIYDVYDADGQLKEHLEPPFPIRRYLPSAHFYLRDSNFYLNFSDNALAAQNFLSIEKKEKFDGVISLDVSFTKNILDVLGGVSVPSYNERLTSDNFFELADRYSRESFFPGSTQKKDFLGAAFRAIQSSAITKETPFLAFAQAIATGVSEKHIQLYFNDAAIQNSAIVSGMSPGVFDTRISDEKTINDFTGVFEANLGVNKVNDDIARTVSKNLEITFDGEIRSTINVAYKNNSKKDNYKNYIRFVTPLGSNLETIKINGREQSLTDAITDPGSYESKNFKPPLGLEVLKETQSGKTVYGFLLTVPKESIKTVSLTYSMPKKISTEGALNYSLRFLKQPGTDDFPFGFRLALPEDVNLIGSNQSLNILGNKISYDTQLEKDLQLEIKLAPK